MILSFRDMQAGQFARLPEALHFQGEPNEWVRVTRPGRRLHSFLEGPCFDAAGNLWLVDVPYGRLFRIAPDGTWTLAYQYDGEPHGLALRADGSFVIADYRRGLLQFDPVAETLRVLCDRTNTEAFRGLGDVRIAPNGDIWFTDPGRSSLSDPTGRLFRLRPGQSQPDRILANIPYPNSVAFSPDGTFVYVSVTRANAVWRLLANAPDPGPPMAGVYVQMSGGLGPDGLAVAADGRLAVAHAQAGCAWLFDPLGQPLARIRTPEGLWTTAVCFDPTGQFLLIVDAETGTVWRTPVGDLSTPA